VWLLGNLARATYVGSSDYMWPYSYSKCNEKGRMSQEINACSKVNHYGMQAGRGRGAPEIDILEAMQGDPSEELPNTQVRRPYLSCSLQVSLLELFIASYLARPQISQYRASLMPYFKSFRRSHRELNRKDLF
jgi:Beta-glucan synthesis-associated protein SKN1/KRE6/Sbg1